MFLSLFVIFNHYKTTGDIVNKDVSLKGTKRDGVFYATEVSDTDSVTPVSSPKSPSKDYMLPPPRY